jgi:hypothetical protein
MKINLEAMLLEATIRNIPIKDCILGIENLSKFDDDVVFDVCRCFYGLPFHFDPAIDKGSKFKIKEWSYVKITELDRRRYLVGKGDLGYRADNERVIKLSNFIIPDGIEAMVNHPFDEQLL